MIIPLIVGTLALSLAILFAWAFRRLPREQWQIFAVLPSRKEPDGTWQGVNLTYYGVFNALAVVVGLAAALFLSGAAGLSLSRWAWPVGAVLAVGIPASRIVNRLVEGHWHGFTIGGAAFVGIIAGPWIVRAISSWTAPSLAAQTTLGILGALAPAYALGEGIGRLACLSFGCCYGRPLAQAPAWMQRLFNPWAIAFDGRLKKACYAHSLDGQPLIPIQALTAVFSSAAGLLGLALFLAGRPLLAYVSAVVLTQIWRFLSEFLRSDYRGGGRISAYQWMALAGAAYTLLLAPCWATPALPLPDPLRGLRLLWTPEALLLLSGIGLFVLLRMGRSTVTAARINFRLQHAPHAD